MLIQNLAGLFDGSGFVRKQGRRPTPEDCGFRPGPLDVLIDPASGRIQRVERQIPPGSCFCLNGEGLVALPGFIDPHTHAIFGGQRFEEYFLRWAGRSYVEIAAAGGGIHSTVRATRDTSDPSLRQGLRARLRRMLRCGATVVEVKSGYADSAEGELRLLRIIQSLSGDPHLPEICPTFLALHALPQGRDESGFVDEMIAALPQIAAAKLAKHVDAFPEKGFFTLESALRLARSAAGFGLAAKIHADELTDLGTSAAFIRAGARSIDHLQCISDEAVALLADSSTVATLLPATSFFVGLPYANARRLLDAGARVALATDFNPGTAPASDLQLTHLLAVSQLKMTAPEVLCATTLNAAAAVGLEATHGAILPGRAGNLLLYRAGPDVDQTGIRLLQAILLERAVPERVIVRGGELPPTRDEQV
ncbi:MAG: imidazolonepropionase [Phycisphaerae bacterium]|nr:imidazolonepropionase [Phycisphaerae bacterium]MDW8262361.1 imidazolonepropionase [Phycisphaerales bacterium]